MSKINNGGPAFPAGSVRKSRPAHDAGGDWVETDRIQPLHSGLSLRDYFAAKIAAGDAAADEGWELDGATTERRQRIIDARARLYYEIADAMLEARKS